METHYSTEREAPRLPRYWAFRITEILPLPYWQTCTLYGLLFFVVLLGALMLTGADFSNETYIRGLVLMPFLAGYITALGPVASQSANKMIGQLEFCLKPGAPVNRFETESYTLNTSTFWVWTVIFQVVSLASQMLGSERLNASDWVIFAARQFLFLHYTFYVFLYVKVLQISGFLDKWVDVSVFNTHDLAAVGRLGISLSALVGFALAFVSAIQIALGAPLGVLVMAFVMSLPAYFLIGFTLYLPARAIQRKVISEKEAEKKRISIAIQEQRRLKVLGEDLGGCELLDYQKRIYHLREWPFDLTTIRAFCGILVFPIISGAITVFVRTSLM